MLRASKTITRERSEKLRRERREEREVEAQEGHEEAEEVTTQENCVEAKKETNSMHEESDVSKRHMTWWKNAWIRMDGGPHMQYGARPSTNLASSQKSSRTGSRR